MKMTCQNHFTWLDLKNIFFSLTIHKILTSLTSCSACKNEITNQNIIVVQRSNNLLIRRTSLPKFTLNKAKSIDNHNKQVANWFVYLAACFVLENSPISKNLELIKTISVECKGDVNKWTICKCIKF